MTPKINGLLMYVLSDRSTNVRFRLEGAQSLQESLDSLYSSNSSFSHSLSLEHNLNHHHHHHHSH